VAIGDNFAYPHDYEKSGEPKKDRPNRQCLGEQHRTARIAARRALVSLPGGVSGCSGRGDRGADRSVARRTGRRRCGHFRRHDDKWLVAVFARWIMSVARREPYPAHGAFLPSYRPVEIIDLKFG
jgi:hypothetical protein